MAVQSLQIPRHRQLACRLLDRSSIGTVHLAEQKLIAYVAPYNILLILKTPRCKKNLENAVNLKIMLKLKYIVNSNIHLFRNNCRSTFWKTGNCSKPSTTMLSTTFEAKHFISERFVGPRKKEMTYYQHKSLDT